ncbi:MAG: hypothetical protein UY76_C0034G0002 [Candidatus Uhrbacteria bacterium GW2011_GWA2_52_8d]|uniref:Uncharacterized protein n=1 Tax=Candidatus Uhrbacteria bacterium GW2011_GWA2_52_8d TaxID=1618979 RepID=A0A0G1XN16_9BACT|nr:MAG: hypothetical protein UY76_C0034G0002 [Candidatus Uhrbacteria bacterium GW2011_GWA2_52_8d]
MLIRLLPLIRDMTIGECDGNFLVVASRCFTTHEKCLESFSKSFSESSKSCRFVWNRTFLKDATTLVHERPCMLGFANIHSKIYDLFGCLLHTHFVMSA